MGFRVWGLGLRVLGFRVWGLGGFWLREAAFAVCRLGAVARHGQAASFGSGLQGFQKGNRINPKP